MVAAKGYILDTQAEAITARVFTAIHEARDEKFGNARMVRNFFERTISTQADRLSSIEGEPDKQQLVSILKEDLPIHEFAPNLEQELLNNDHEKNQEKTIGEIRLT